jgi:hypothetical protein
MVQVTDYKFKAEQFGLTDKGVHFLRRGFNYQTVDYSEINYAEIRNGKVLRNWFLIFLLGLILLIPGIYMSVPIIEAIQTYDLSTRQVRIVLYLFIPLIGGYFVYSSLQTGTIFIINYGPNKNFSFSLIWISKKNEMNFFKEFLRDKLGGKLKIND